MEINRQKPTVIIGGMGPLASSKFISKIYKSYEFSEKEQEAPFIIHYCDPGFPDRTSNFLRGRESVVFERLLDVLTKLDSLDPSEYIVCCLTIHHVIKKLPVRLQSKVISLIDVILNELVFDTRQYLFLSTTGTREVGVLETHPRWPQVMETIQFLDAGDQESFHRFIYNELKLGVESEALLDFISNVSKKYGVQGLIFGCTELHLILSKVNKNAPHLNIIDPLDVLAKKWKLLHKTEKNERK